MKKIFLIIISIFSFINVVRASDSFYIGFKVDNIRYVKDKNGKIVYSPEFRAIQKKGTDELAYCIQPGVLISLDDYTPYEEYNENFKITSEQMRKVKEIARYGYMYENHTDIKWYVVTQYMIWHAVMPENWDIYFVDENKNRLSDMFIDEINEINSIINSAHSKPSIENIYNFNYQEDIYIYDDYNLLKYYHASSGEIENNHLHIKNDLKPGDYTYNLTLVNNIKPLFYNHPTGQDLFTRGEILENNVNFKIHITAGNVSINECNEETFKDEFIGGTYEILDIDDEVVDEITCKKNEECLSKVLPVGNYKIRVKNLSNDFEINENIYEVVVTDQSTSKAEVCSLKKMRNITINNNSDINVSVTNNDNKVYNNFTNIINNTSNIVNNITNTKVINNYIYKKSNSDNNYQMDYNYNKENNNNNVTNITKNDIKNKKTNSIKNKTQTKNCEENCFCIKEESKNISIKDKLLNSDNININKTVEVPNTNRNSYLVLVISIFSLITYYVSFMKHEKRI